MTRRDLLLALGAVLVGAAGMAVSDEPTARSVDALGVVLLVGAAAPLLVATARPVAALLATTAVVLVSFALDYPAGPVTAMPLAALYVATVEGRRLAAGAVALLFAGGGSAFRLLADGDPLVQVLLNAALFVLVFLLGDAVASRRALRAEVDERLRRAARDQARLAQERLVRERMHIARELHDVMAHTVATMTVQAGAAADTLDDDPEQARKALRHIRGAARQAMAELRATVSVLRDGDDSGPPPPAPRLDQLDDLVEGTSATGLRVELVRRGDVRPLPGAVEVTAFRVAQEALTNVVRHAGASRATVTLVYEPDAVAVAVDDDGRGAGGAASTGFGLRGLRERVDALDGDLSVGASPDGGFRVAARLPVAEEATA